MSSVVDEDTAKAVQSGRETVGGMLRYVHGRIKRIFLIALVGFFGSFLAMRYYVWDYLERVTKSQLSEEVAANTDLIARTPFDVILMQFKIALIVGAFLTVAALVYYGRKELIHRVDRRIDVTPIRLYTFLGLVAALALIGMWYAYSVFFPLMFMFLAEQAYFAGAKPSYGIVRYTDFLLLLTISFGLAAQLPLLMGLLSYGGIVSYETFRDKWRYAILGIFVFGAVFSPPDPFTQIMWAMPLIVLYIFSLGIAKIATNVRRAGQENAPVEGTTFQTQGKIVAAAAAVIGIGTVAALAAGADQVITEQLLGPLPESISIPVLGDQGLPTAYDAGETLDVIVTGLQVGLLTAVAGLTVVIVQVLRNPVIPPEGQPETDPADIDVGELDAAGVRAAPAAAFEALSEEEALVTAREHMEEDPEKAQAILDRFDEVNEEEGADDDADGEDTAETADDLAEDEDSDAVLGTAAGMASAFSDDEKDEDDIGGYLYDIQFILSSLQSRLFVIFGTFMAVFIGGFGALYYGALGVIVDLFVDQVPEEAFDQRSMFADVYPDDFAMPDPTSAGVDQASPAPEAAPLGTDILIALHPVEVLLFMVKFSGIVAILVTLPLILYYAWPAIAERNFVSSGDRRMFLVWGGAITAGLIGGSLLGAFVVAPVIMSYLVLDALNAGMIISFRVQSFLWVIFYFTVGMGLFANVPITMALFHYGNIVSFDTVYGRWRELTFGIFVAAWLLSPSGVITMIVMAVPMTAAFLTGLAIMWVLVADRKLARIANGGKMAASRFVTGTKGILTKYWT